MSDVLYLGAIKFKEGVSNTLRATVGKNIFLYEAGDDMNAFFEGINRNYQGTSAVESSVLAKSPKPAQNLVKILEDLE